MAPKTGYVITDIVTLKALTAEQRTDGYARLVKSPPNNQPPAWYIFKESSTENGDDDNILIPNDYPSTGRFYKQGAYSASGSSTTNSLWTIIADDYTASPGEKIVAYTNDGVNRTITLPTGMPDGTEIQIINTNFSVTISVDLNGVKFKGLYNTNLEFSTAYKAATLVYIGVNIGWIPTVDDLFTTVSSGGGGS